MNRSLSPLAEQLRQIIFDLNGELPDWFSFIDSKYIRELNETHPNLLTYKIKRHYGLLRLYDPTLETQLYLLEVKNLEKRLNRLAQETRYKQLKRLREENRNPEYKFIYGDYPIESDDVISYMQGMSAEEIYERRKKVEIIRTQALDRFTDNYQRKSCSVLSLQ